MLRKIGLHKFNSQNRGAKPGFGCRGARSGALPSARGEAKNLLFDDESDYWFLILMAKWMMFTRGNYPACSSSSRILHDLLVGDQAGNVLFDVDEQGVAQEVFAHGRTKPVLHDLHRREHMQRPLPGIRRSNIHPEIATRVVMRRRLSQKTSIER